MAAEQIVGWRPESIALVDLSYLWKKTWHAQPRDAQPGHAAQAALDQLAGIRESVEHVIVCLDAPPYRRREVYPEYKAHRPAPESEEVAQKKWLLERIEKDGYVIAKAKGYEADDVIHTLAYEYHALCSDVRIVASDKDLAYCVRLPNVRMFVPSVGERPAEVRGPEEMAKKYGVDPVDMPLWLALVGDKSDNIPGVPGIGEKKAAELIGECVSLQGIAETLAVKSQEPKRSKMWDSLATHWEQLRLSLKLATLETVPLDAQALLQRREPERLIKDDEEEEMMNGESYVNQDAGDVQDAEFIPISKAPENAEPANFERAAKSEPPPKPDALAKTKPPAESTEDLQPTNIESAYRLAKGIYNGRLYGKFQSAEAIFTVIVKAREMGIKVTAALDGFHVIEGKPSPSADMIRALAMRHPDCEYFRLIESTAESATWETKSRRNPEPTRYTYTLAEARQAGLRGGNWDKRPRDMICKTAGSKLARIEYPEATGGLYCPEEMGDAA